jgi:hypothetical protein
MTFPTAVPLSFSFNENGYYAVLTRPGICFKYGFLDNSLFRAEKQIMRIDVFLIIPGTRTKAVTAVRAFLNTSRNNINQ